MSLTGTVESPVKAPPATKRDAISFFKLQPESEATAGILSAHRLTAQDRDEIVANAQMALLQLRASIEKRDIVETFFQEMDMGSREGLSLMSLAEALLRVPDTATAETLIQEKLSQGNWQRFRTTSHSPPLRALGFFMQMAATLTRHGSVLSKSTGAITLPTIRIAAQKIVQLMARRFVFAPTIESAIAVAIKSDHRERYSFDMLGEGARTLGQAAAFRDAYFQSIAVLGQAIADNEAIDEPSLSIKLSALHPRFEVAKHTMIRQELSSIVEELAYAAMIRNVDFTIDAEEADRLEPTIDVIEHLARSPRLKGWDGLGLAVQAYGKRARAVINYISELGREGRRRFKVRLVKGAYWDAEVKHAQSKGLRDYPVFTSKAATDVSYLACARQMLESDHILAQFATHNVHTVMAVRRMAGMQPFEFQRLHGMGEKLYEMLRADGMTTPVRVYAPVGQFKELLPYLIRRMLENMANSSFVRSAFDPQQDVKAVVQDPIAIVEAGIHSQLPLPREIFADRKNASGLDLGNRQVLDHLSHAAKSIGGVTLTNLNGGTREIIRPPPNRKKIGSVPDADEIEIETALASAELAFDSWNARDVASRADILENAADLIEQQMGTYIALIVAEAGRTLRDAESEVREAVDFCRYYAGQARIQLSQRILPGITGEQNVMSFSGRGIFACISPWNFPLAIFLGQVTAALVAGNTVIAKPAEQTPFVAAAAVQTLHEAGVPPTALHILHGDATVGRKLTSDPRVSGIAFTGSTEAAVAINRALAARDSAIGVLIAETGGINAMFVDATALPEQVVDDVIVSGFYSAGQRCSSLRHLFVQEECADQIIALVAGAMNTLCMGNPAEPATDIGPLIDGAAKAAVLAHIEDMKAKGAKIVHQAVLPPACADGCFVPPTLIEIPQPEMLEKEIFGPVVHVTRWNRNTLERMLKHVRSRGYGLTLGVHSRIAGFADDVIRQARCGNNYINRNTVGAVVGVQPFGGRGLSGTGPKAGGPNYLMRFATEEITTTNLTAIGGDIGLLVSAS